MEERMMDVIVEIYNHMNDSDKDAFTLEDAEDMVEDQIRMDKEWSYVKKKYKLNVTNFPFFVIVNSLSLLRPFPSFSDIVPHIHLETNIHNDYEYGLYYRMFQYIWTVLLFQLRQ